MNPFQNWTTWSHTPLGSQLIDEEQAWLDRTVSDVFGYHALELGPAPLDALRASRMSCRVRARWPGEPDCAGEPSAVGDIETKATPSAWEPVLEKPCDLVMRLEELPIQSASLDLLVLPHALEVTADPHQLLREAERVLIPEGKLIVTGFNPFSLWILRKYCRSVNRFPPAGHQWMTLPRLKDWLKLLNFDLGAGAASAYGAYMPPLDPRHWLNRFRWMDPAGRRWWPLAGGVYFIMAVKRVSGIRLVGRSWRDHAVAGKKAVATAGANMGRRTP